MKAPRYEDATDVVTLDALGSHAAVARDLEAHGFTRFMVLRSHYESGRTFTWSVLADPSRCVAAAILETRGSLTLYVVTKCEDGWVLETQWLVGAAWRVGPAAFMDDRPAKRRNCVDSTRTVASTLALHETQRKKHGVSPIPWTAPSYVRFRRESGWLVLANGAAESILGVLFIVLFALACITGLALLHVGWIVFGLACGAFVVAVKLFLDRVCGWLARIVGKRLPLRTRALFVEAVREDD